MQENWEIDTTAVLQYLVIMNMNDFADVKSCCYQLQLSRKGMVTMAFLTIPETPPSLTLIGRNRQVSSLLTEFKIKFCSWILTLVKKTNNPSNSQNRVVGFCYIAIFNILIQSKFFSLKCNILAFSWEKHLKCIKSQQQQLSASIAYHLCLTKVDRYQKTLINTCISDDIIQDHQSFKLWLKFFPCVLR